MRPRRSTLDRPLSGAHCDLADLLGLRAWAGRLQGSVRGAVARTDGRHPARGRGRGLDFEEVRPYQPGDDVRSIDWRVTARSQQPYSRVYRTERERPVLLVVDQRPTMFFGSRHCCKSVLAAQLAAWLAWAALGQGDRVGGLVLTSGAPVILPPRRSRRSVLQLLEATARANQALSATLPPAPAAALEQALATLPGLARSGASLWLLSDLTGLEQGQSLQQLRQLARRHTVNAIWVHDPLELQLPGADEASTPLPVSDGRRRLSLDPGDLRLGQRFAATMARRRHNRKQQLRRRGVGWIEAATSQAPAALAPLLRERLRG